MSSKEELDAQAVNNFREYLRIPSVHPNVDYEPCVKFLEKQAKSLDLPISIHYMVPKKPIVVLTWTGTQPSLPAILLNSHMDVVPVFEDEWTYKPFSADIDEDNNIHARGSQDVKCVGIQYLEAIRRLKLQGVTFKRTIHVSFVPDEEIGGIDGMKKFVETEEFRNLNIGVCLDEGAASDTEEFALLYGERCMWHLHIHIPGTPGHGSILMQNTAGEKLAYLVNKFFEFRKQEQKKLADDQSLGLGDVITVNLTKLKGGVQTNVVPPEFVISFDCRIPPETDLKKWEETIDQWCTEAGSGIWIEYELKQTHSKSTKLDNTNPYWLALKEATDQLGLKLKPQICGAGTDNRYLRNLGIPALGFSPINNTPILIHSHNEHLAVNKFLKGIEIYIKIITKLGNLDSKND